MSNVRKVDFRPEVNENLVSILKQFLAEAEAGTLESGAFCGANRDGSLTSAISESADVPRVLAAVVRVQHRLLIGMDDA